MIPERFEAVETPLKWIREGVILTPNAWDVNQDGWDMYYGYGILDAEASYDSILT